MHARNSTTASSCGRSRCRPFSPWGEGGPKGPDEGAFTSRKVAPHQFGRMTYDRAFMRPPVAKVAHATVSHGLTSSPPGEREKVTGALCKITKAGALALLPLGRRCPEGADEGAFTSRKVAPHQFGRMTYDRAFMRPPVAKVGARDRKSWPHVLSPEGRGKNRLCPLQITRAGIVPDANVAELEFGQGLGVEPGDVAARR